MRSAFRCLLGCGLVCALLAGPAQAADPVVVAGGDVACDPADVDFNAGDGTTSPAPGRCHQRYTAEMIQSLAPVRLLALGDLQYEDGTLAKFQASYDLTTSWGRTALKAITRPVPGNHEYGSSPSNLYPDAEGYFTTFSAQLSPFGADATDPKKGWYSFNIGSWHVVAINSECAAGLASRVGWSGGCEPGSAEERWLREDLAADRHDCTLAYWHHPLFSSGTDGATQADHPEMEPIWKALQDDYADVVLSGHAHHYERFRLQDSLGNPAPGRGIREWIVGTGGKEMTSLNDQPDEGSEFLRNTTFGVLALTLHGSSQAHPRGWYQWEFVDDGQSGSDFTDSGSADCVGPPRPPGTGKTSPPPAKPAAPVSVAPKRQRIRARVTRVVDGDTIKARATTGRRRRYTVRLLGIDAPSRRPAECAAISATRKLKRLTFVRGKGRRVTLITDPSQPLRDRRGRLLAYVERRGGVNLAGSQVRRGWARVLGARPRFELFDRFRASQRRARRARRGAWRLCHGDFHRRVRRRL